ncbi:unnamed protein product [Ostreobium quekettii]|uniref:Secreted protein n=1 Tax=Ostreobium quekettii TaxID=121088 RepID=A0A8S1JBN7_9CHLO|nr:unnamed protein product [Ostreobium quekettii]
MHVRLLMSYAWSLCLCWRRCGKTNGGWKEKMSLVPGCCRSCTSERAGSFVQQGDNGYPSDQLIACSTCQADSAQLAQDGMPLECEASAMPVEPGCSIGWMSSQVPIVSKPSTVH